MYPCSSCDRHLREADERCPFCGTIQEATSPPPSCYGTYAIIVATMLGTSACGTRPVDADGGTTTTLTSTTADATESGTEVTSTSEGEVTTDETNGPGLSFYGPPDQDIAGVLECDNFMQDCPDGEKCVPYASTGGPLDANKCVPVTGANAAGEPCVYGGDVEATDDCDVDTHCINLVDVDGMGVGTCTPFCQGTPDDPVCPDQTHCMFAFDGYFAMCVTTCNPLMQDCAAGLMCGWGPDHWSWGCLAEPEAPPANGEPCDVGALDGCGLNEGCVSAEVLPDCAGADCCTEFCDVSDQNFACTNPMLGCQTLWQNAQAPPGLENLGVCASTAP